MEKSKNFKLRLFSVLTIVITLSLFLFIPASALSSGISQNNSQEYVQALSGLDYEVIFYWYYPYSEDMNSTVITQTVATSNNAYFGYGTYNPRESYSPGLVEQSESGKIALHKDNSFFTYGEDLGAVVGYYRGSQRASVTNGDESIGQYYSAKGYTGNYSYDAYLYDVGTYVTYQHFNVDGYNVPRPHLQKVVVKTSGFIGGYRPAISPDMFPEIKLTNIGDTYNILEHATQRYGYCYESLPDCKYVDEEGITRYKYLSWSSDPSVQDTAGYSSSANFLSVFPYNQSYEVGYYEGYMEFDFTDYVDSQWEQTDNSLNRYLELNVVGALFAGVDNYGVDGSDVQGDGLMIIGNIQDVEQLEGYTADQMKNQYNSGFNDGVKAAYEEIELIANGGFLEWAYSAIVGFLNVELFMLPGTEIGFTIGGLLGVIITASLAAVFFKIFNAS